MTEDEDEGTCLDNDALGAAWYDEAELKAQEYKGPFTVEQIKDMTMDDYGAHRKKLLTTIQKTNWLQWQAE